MKERNFISFKEQMKKILIFYSLIPIIFTALIGYGMIYYLNYQAIKSNNQKNLDFLAQTTDELISKTYTEIERLSSDESIKNVVLNGKVDEKTYSIFYKSLLNREVKGKFVLYDENINILMTNAEFLGKSNGYIWGFFYRMLSNKNKAIDFVGKFYFRDGHSSNYSVGKAIKIDGRVRGYLVHHILDSNFQEIMGNSENFGVVITDRYNNIIATNSTNFEDSLDKLKKEFRIGKKHLKYGNKRYYINRKKVFYSNVEIYCISSVDYIFNNFSESFLYITVVFIFLIFFMSKVAKRIALNKTKTIEEIVRAIKNIETGDLDTEIDINSNDEFELIGRTYNQMLLNIKKLIEKNKEEARHSVLAEIKQLESQFNPHFLFNTLEMLRYTIHLDKVKANKIILNMASILRFSIENKSSEVTIEREIFYIKNYLELQKLRLGENFEYLIEGEEELKNRLTPKLIVQPIVENSIKYGYSQDREFKIYIRIRRINRDIRIEIFDNGSGIKREVLRELRNKLYLNSLTMKENLGIYSVQRRIELLYGDSYGLKIRSTVGKGTYIKIEIPFRDSEVR